MTPEVINEYKNALEKGEPITENYYVSTSKDKGEAFDKNTKYKIHSKNGKQIEKLSIFPHEKEILFKEGTKFKILNVYKDSDGFNRIEMEEI